jgi:hypothetical protein
MDSSHQTLLDCAWEQPRGSCSRVLHNVVVLSGSSHRTLPTCAVITYGCRRWQSALACTTQMSRMSLSGATTHPHRYASCRTLAATY